MESFMENYITGTFTMFVDYDDDSDQVLNINIETKPSISSSGILIKTIQELIVTQLLEDNSEYKKTHDHYPDKMKPKIILWDYEDSKYFKSGGKQKWTIK